MIYDFKSFLICWNTIMGGLINHFFNVLLEIHNKDFAIENIVKINSTLK